MDGEDAAVWEAGSVRVVHCTKGYKNNLTYKQGGMRWVIGEMVAHGMGRMCGRNERTCLCKIPNNKKKSVKRRNGKVANVRKSAYRPKQDARQSYTFRVWRLS